MTSTIIENIYKICENKINKIKGKKFRCMVNQFHECNHFCTTCNDFICHNCSRKHEKSHQLILLDSKLQEMKEKLEKYKEISSIYEKNKDNNNNKSLIEIDTSLTNNTIGKIDEIIKKLREVKKNVVSNFELREDLIKIHNKEDENIVKKKKAEREKIHFEDIPNETLQNINNNLNKSNDAKDIGTYFMKFFGLLDNTITVSENKISFTDYEKNNRKTNELNKIIGDEVNNLYESSHELLPLIEQKIRETEKNFTKSLCNNLKISTNEYNNQKKNIFKK